VLEICGGQGLNHCVNFSTKLESCLQRQGAMMRILPEMRVTPSCRAELA
jgi:hypothetical protein